MSDSLLPTSPMIPPTTFPSESNSIQLVPWRTSQENPSLSLRMLTRSMSTPSRPIESLEHGLLFMELRGQTCWCVSDEGLKTPSRDFEVSALRIILTFPSVNFTYWEGTWRGVGHGAHDISDSTCNGVCFLLFTAPKTFKAIFLEGNEGLNHSISQLCNVILVDWIYLRWEQRLCQSDCFSIPPFAPQCV